MGSNIAMLGQKYPVRQRVLGLAKTYAYALATDHDDARYASGERVPPLSIVIATLTEGLVPPLTDPALMGDVKRLARLLHGEEDISWHAPFAPDDVLAVETTVAAIDDKGTHELLVLATEVRNQRTELVATTRSGLMIREGKGMGIKRLREELSRSVEPPPPLAQVSWTVAPDQARRYADVSEDHNPIHLDTAAAQAAGLKGCVLHGLCTMAFAERVVVAAACANEPRRLRRLKVRFSRPVYLGDTLTCSIWELETRGGSRTLGLEVRTQEGSVVLRDGLAEVSI